MNNRRTLATELGVFETFTPHLPASYQKSAFCFAREYRAVVANPRSRPDAPTEIRRRRHDGSLAEHRACLIC